MSATAQFVEITLDSETLGGGWKLYHYIPGTTTLKDVWVDRAKGTPAAQPVVADANGAMSFYGDGLYDLVVYNSADVLKYTWEDVYIVEVPSLGTEGSTLASANTVTLGTATEIYNHVSGAVTINGLSGTQAFVILTFDSTPTLTDGGSFQLRNRTTRQARADETLMFVNDGGGVWREVTPALRLANSQYLTGRNNAGAAEVNIIKVNTSDQIEFGATVKNFSLDADPTTDLQAATKQYVAALGNSGVNPIINGNMEVWQRGTTFTSPATATFAADRWGIAYVGAGVVTLRQSTNVPTVAQATVLFNYSLEVDVTTADASLAATDVYALYQKIEGYNWRHFAQRQLTLSFWVMSTKTGLHSISLQNSGVDRSYVAEYTINVADTWEQKTLTLTASPSTGTWDYVTGVGAMLRFSLAAGSNFTTSSLNTWNSAATHTSTNQVNVMDSASNFFRVTGVKLELGSLATPVQFAPFEAELARCKRYYQKSFPYATAPAQSAGADLGGISVPAVLTTTGALRTYGILPVTMRATPSITTYNPSAANTQARDENAAADCASTATVPSDSGFTIGWTGNAGSAVGNRMTVYWAASAEL